MTCNIDIKRLTGLGLGKEAVAGTLVDPTVFIPFSSASVKPVIETIKNTNAYGVIDEVYSVKAGKIMSETTIEGSVLDNSIGHLLSAVLSDTTVVDNGDNTADHTFNRQNDTCNNTYSVYDANSVKNKQSANNMIDSLEIKYIAGQTLTFKASFKGKKIVDAVNDLTPTYNTTEDEFLASNAIIKFAADIAGLDAATLSELKEFTLNMTKGIVDTVALHGDTGVASINNTNFNVFGSYVTLFKTEDNKNRVLNGELSACRVEIEGRDLDAGKAKLTVELPKLSYESWDSSTDNNGLIEETIGFVGSYDATIQKTIEIKLKNDNTTQY